MAGFLSPTLKAANITLAADLKNITKTATAAGSIVTTEQESWGVRYWEGQSNAAGDLFLGIAGPTFSTANNVGAAASAGYSAATASVIVNGTTVVTGFAAYTAFTRVQCWVDLDKRLGWWRVGTGNWNNNASANPATGVGGVDLSSVFAPKDLIRGAIGLATSGNQGWFWGWRADWSYVPPVPGRELNYLNNTFFNAAAKGTNISLTNSNQSMSHATTGHEMAKSIDAINENALVYSECTDSSVSDGIFGIASSTASVASFVGADAQSTGIAATGDIYVNGAISGNIGAMPAGGRLCMAKRGNKVWFRVNNGLWNGVALASSDPAANLGGIDISTMGTPRYLACSVYGPSIVLDFRSGSYDWTYSAPTGFRAINDIQQGSPNALTTTSATFATPRAGKPVYLTTTAAGMPTLRSGRATGLTTTSAAFASLSAGIAQGFAAPGPSLASPTGSLPAPPVELLTDNNDLTAAGWYWNYSGGSNATLTANSIERTALDYNTATRKHDLSMTGGKTLKWQATVKDLGGTWAVMVAWDGTNYRQYSVNLQTSQVNDDGGGLVSSFSVGPVDGNGERLLTLQWDQGTTATGNVEFGIGGGNVGKIQGRAFTVNYPGVAGGVTGTANGLTTSSPVLGSPNGGIATPLTVAAATPASPNAGRPLGLTTASPALGSPAGGRAVSTLASSPPVQPSLQAGSPVGLTTSSPVLGSPAGDGTLVTGNPVGLTTAGPALGSPSAGMPVKTIVMSPVLGSPAAVISPSGLTTSGVVLGSPRGGTVRSTIVGGGVWGSPAAGVATSLYTGVSLIAKPNGFIPGPPIIYDPGVQRGDEPVKEAAQDLQAPLVQLALDKKDDRVVAEYGLSLHRIEQLRRREASFNPNGLKVTDLKAGGK